MSMTIYKFAVVENQEWIFPADEATRVALDC